MYKSIGLAATANAVAVATILPNTGAGDSYPVVLAASVFTGLITWAVAYKVLAKYL